MKNFLVVFDGYKIGAATLEYALQAAKTCHAGLSAVFLNDPSDRKDSAKKAAGSRGVLGPAKRMKDIDKKKRELAIQQFQRACSKVFIPYTVNTEKKSSAKELVHDSMFADLLIIGRKRGQTKESSKGPAAHLKDLLSDVQCPVLLTPSVFMPLDKLILLYDGKPSSIYAIKMFSYLFGDPGIWPAEVFTIKEQFMADSHVPDNKLIRGFIRAHFPKAKFVVARGDAEKEIPGYLKAHKENELVVLGAYRRSQVSRWFKTSMADILMQKTESPLFIAHT